jgi:hypothetical protein
MTDPKMTKDTRQEDQRAHYVVQYDPPNGTMFAGRGTNLLAGLRDTLQHVTLHWIDYPCSSGGFYNVARILKLDPDGKIVGSKHYRFTLTIEECDAKEATWRLPKEVSP